MGLEVSRWVVEVLELVFHVLGLGLGGFGLGFVVPGLGFEVFGLGFVVPGLGFEVLALGFEEKFKRTLQVPGSGP